MESNAFGSSHLPSQALVVLSEAASGLHEALRGQRPFPTRLPDAKDLHNMSLVGSYGTHLLHSFHPHLLQTLNHGMLAANGGPASYFADRGLGKPSVLSNFQLPSAFSPPKYIGISLDQNLFNGNDSFRTDSASPTCTSHESMEGSNDYDNGEKGESPRSNNSDPRDLRHVHSNNGGGSNSSSSSGGIGGIKASSAAATATSMAAAAAAVAASVASTTSSPASVNHLGHHHHHTHHHHHHPNGGLLAAASLGGMGSLGIPVSCAGLRGVTSGLSGLTTAGAVGVGIGSGGSSSGSNSSGLASVLSLPPGHVPDICPICGIKISAEEWNSHFLTELDRLYKLSSGLERTNLQASYMFAPPCPAQENAIRTSHNRWETFQRIRNNRQNRLRIKGRKRKYGNDLYFMENLFCNSCPICKRKYAIEAGKMPPEEDTKMQEEIETVDVESCNDDVPDSGSELTSHSQLSVNSLSHGHHHNNIGNTTLSTNMHSSNSQPGKLDGILYRTACVINKDAANSEDDLNATSTSGGGGGGIAPNWNQAQHNTAATITTQQGHISVKNVSELSSTTHHFYNADSCGAVDERSSSGVAGGGNCNGKDVSMETCNANDSDEDVIVDDDDSIKITNLCSNKKRKYEETVVSSRTSDNHSPILEQERPRSEPQVTSTEPNMEMANNNNNNINNNNSKYTTFEELRAKQQQQTEAENGHSIGGNVGGVGGGNGGGGVGNCGSNVNLMVPGLTQLDTKVGFSSDNKPDDENKCFICKTGIKDFATESFFRGRNLYFHQSCANVMSSYRLSKDLQQQQQNLIQQQQREAQKSPSPQQLVNL
ncbi:protein Teyrha-meyrha [Anastrepha ludens]|uniref:protein Teyrha-meyrha n=1 Tax=Anastrepha ludens TaxID=28586 RepID=UPI0023AF0D92|nr:protein Teyrha-meyrha [Anastrepha ludens]